MSSTHVEKLWEIGQRHLAAGRYVAARRELESAESVAWRNRDAASLARIYLPLMEARRLLRYQAVEGVIVISGTAATGEVAAQNGTLAEFLRRDAGTFLMASTASSIPMKAAGSVQYEARRRGAALEAMLLLQHHGAARLASPADPTFAGGLAVRFVARVEDVVDPEAAAGMAGGGAYAIPLPGPGVYEAADVGARAMHALARESLLVAWETLALRWQARHALSQGGVSTDAAWQELAWLRLALRIDPGCEPVAMRVIALAESLLRM